MKKIGITGASGFIGSNIVSYYLDKQWEVTVLTRDKSKFKSHPNLKIIISDLICIEEITIQKFLDQKYLKDSMATKIFIVS